MNSTTTKPDHSWAQYLDYMEGVPVVVRPPAVHEPKRDSTLWGLISVIVLTLMAIKLSELPVWPFTLTEGKHPIEPVMLAIILGMLVSSIHFLDAAYKQIGRDVERLRPRLADMISTMMRDYILVPRQW
jgi:hypothetical protein